MKLRQFRAWTIILALFFTILAPGFDTQARSDRVSKFEIWYFKPSQVNAAANYRVLIDINVTVGIHEYIKLIFPPEWTMPDVPLPGYSEYWDHELERILTSIYIGTSPCTKCQGLPIIRTNKRKNEEFIKKYNIDSENSILFRTHIELTPNGPYDPIPITVADRTGIRNAPEPGYYKVQVLTESEPDAVYSNEIKVVRSHIEAPKVELTNNAIGEKTGMKISFHVGEGGSLDARESRITVILPKGYTTPATMSANHVKINGQPLPIDPQTFPFSNTISMVTPVSTDNNQLIEIVFSDKAGIVNPLEKGDYTLLTYTSFETDAISSIPFIIVRAGQRPFVDPPYAGQPASFKFSVEFPGKVVAGDLIEIMFPEGTEFPRSIATSSVVVDGTPCIHKPGIAANERKVRIYAPKDMPKGAVMVEISKTAAIKNPPNPGFYTISFKTQGSDNFSPTDPYPILIKLITATVNLVPINAKSNARWEIDGSLAFTGDLENKDSMTLVFPEGTIIPSSVTPDLVTFNGENVTEVSGSGSVLTFKVPIKLPSGSSFKIIIPRDVGLITTEKSAIDYTIKITTSKDPKGGISEQFFIAPAIPVTTMLLNPPKPDGKNGWYIKPPLMDFTTTSPTAEIRQWWNEKEENYIKWLPGTWSQVANNQYINYLHWQAVDTFGSEDVKTYELKIDTLIPTFVVTTPIGGERDITKKSSYKITGMADSTELAMYDDLTKALMVVPKMYVNGKEITVVQPGKPGAKEQPDDAGYFEVEVALAEGENIFEVSAEDDAGNRMIKKVIVTKDTTPPELAIIKPTPGQTNDCNEIEVLGKTEPGASVSFGSNLVSVEIDGNFTFDYKLMKIGINEVSIVSEDTIGNQAHLKYSIWYGTTTQLFLDNKNPAKQPEINGIPANEKNLPYINAKNSTMVPFRFLAEKLMGGFVGYDTKTKTAKITLVNGTLITHVSEKNTFTKTEKGKKPEIVTMKNVSELKSGSLFLPMREFIEKGLGLPVMYNAKTKVATVVKPPDTTKCKK